MYVILCQCVDAFLHQVSTGIRRLRDTVAKVCDIIRNRVEAALEQIHSFLLFDSDLAFSKAWVSAFGIRMPKIVLLIKTLFTSVSCAGRIRANSATSLVSP
jgi:hypothetical protein